MLLDEYLSSLAPPLRTAVIDETNYRPINISPLRGDDLVHDRLTTRYDFDSLANKARISRLFS